jgi:Na+-driven multidrug efflux pump
VNEATDVDQRIRIATDIVTEGSLWRSVATLAVPVVLTNILQAGYQLVNAFFLGHAGRDAVAAVAASGPLFSVLIALGGGLSTAGSVFIAQYAGARRTDMVDHVAAQTLLMVGAVAAGFATLGLVANGAKMRMKCAVPSIRAGSSGAMV